VLLRLTVEMMNESIQRAKGIFGLTSGAGLCVLAEVPDHPEVLLRACAVSEECTEECTSDVSRVHTAVITSLVGVIQGLAGLFTLMIGLGTAAAAPVARLGIVDVTAAFPDGPYLALTVDPEDTDRMVITTGSGRVAWTWNGGVTATEALVVAPRSYVSAPLRSLQPLFSLSGQGPSTRVQIAGLLGEPPGTRRFLLQLNNGQPVAKWQYWMAVDDPATDVLDATVPAPGRPALAATGGGVFVSDRDHAAWLRTAGAPHPRGEGLVAFAVAVDPVDPARVFAGTSRGLWVSRDGGATFGPHPDPALADVNVLRLTWDPSDSTHLLALTARAVYQSRDSGGTFERAFGSDDGVRAVAVASDGAYVATGRGLIVPGQDQRALAGEPVVGVVPLGDGSYVVATETDLIVRTGADSRVLMRTTTSDPFLRLEGNGTAAWALTRYGIFRIGGDELARAPLLADPPHMESSPEAVERDVLEHGGLGDPTRTRLGKPWTAYLVPQLTVFVRRVSSHDYTADTDATLPYPVRLATMASASSCCGSPLDGSAPESVVLLTWDLAGLFTPTRTPTYPYSIIELNLRAARTQILPEVRWRYREAARIAALLTRPPRDPDLLYLWQMRLAEHAAYLEAMTGRRVVNFGSLTPF
jgi:hypothetical protein